MYSDAVQPLRRAQGSNAFIGGSPRYALEMLGMVLIAGLAYFLAHKPGGVAEALSILAVLAIAAQRMLPLLQQGYLAWANIKGHQASLQDTLALLNQSMPKNIDGAITPISFEREIKLQDLSFRYISEGAWVCQKLNLVIKKGSRIGLIGPTGSGKSTLIDLIMALLEPTDGALVIDDQIISVENSRSWQMHLAHVPQAIYLADTSIEENIAFGSPKDKIDAARIRLAARQAQIDSFIETLPEKYETFVGERGVRLSGGQRQRIGIARALYKQADVLIFDEATSALDNETERSVMDAIDGLDRNLTVVIIAHRLTTLQCCDAIIELNAGSIIRSGTYQELVEEQPQQKIMESNHVI